MAEEILEENEEVSPATVPSSRSLSKGNTVKALSKRKRGGWFQKIPTEIIFSPGGVVLIFAAIGMEIIDLIPLPILDSLTWELIIEIAFMALLSIIAKASFKSMLIPLIVERVPVISDILPSWLLKLLF